MDFTSGAGRADRRRAVLALRFRGPPVLADGVPQDVLDLPVPVPSPNAARLAEFRVNEIYDPHQPADCFTIRDIAFADNDRLISAADLSHVPPSFRCRFAHSATINVTGDDER